MKSDRLFILVGGCMSILSWFIMFGLGLFINSQPYRDQLIKGLEWKSFICSLLTYTPTNVAILCLLSSFCGGCTNYLLNASKYVQTANENSISEPDKKKKLIFFSPSPINGMIRGFVVYITFLGGVYLTSTSNADSPFHITTQDQYARIAGAISLVAFIIGFDQNRFLQLIKDNGKSEGS